MEYRITIRFCPDKRMGSTYLESILIDVRMSAIRYSLTSGGPSLTCIQGPWSTLPRLDRLPPPEPPEPAEVEEAAATRAEVMSLEGRRSLLGRWGDATAWATSFSTSLRRRGGRAE